MESGVEATMGLNRAVHDNLPAWTAADCRERQLKCSASGLIFYLHPLGGVIELT